MDEQEFDEFYHASFRRLTSQVFLAPEFCGGDSCDAVRFDRMGVAPVGDRLVLVSLGEVGGPLEPEGLDQTFTELFAFAISKSRP